MFQAKARASQSCRGKKVQVQLGHCCLIAGTECRIREAADSPSVLIEMFSSALSNTVAPATCGY